MVYWEIVFCFVDQIEQVRQLQRVLRNTYEKKRYLPSIIVRLTPASRRSKTVYDEQADPTEELSARARVAILMIALG
jgi:hypothetical protein